MSKDVTGLEHISNRRLQEVWNNMGMGIEVIRVQAGDSNQEQQQQNFVGFHCPDWLRSS